MGWSIRPAGASDEPARLEVRRQVFVIGQAVPAELEVDGRDPESLHWIAEADGVPVGTARARWVGPGRAKVERVAVLEAFRGRGIGQGLMDAIEADLWARGAEQVVLAAQRSAESFYGRRGYVVRGEPFMEAGIEHVFMTKPRPDPAPPGGQSG